ncbi:glucose 1-dehydrogenase [beta proteobacterium MWH-UniP1]
MLENKIAVVTGANRGIGLAVARTFVIHGAKVIACMRAIDTSAVEKIADARHLDRVQAVTLDLSDDASIKAAIKEIASLTGNKVDVLVNNAGTASGGLFQMTPIAELRRVFEINLIGQILFTQGISRLMTRHHSGSIINITSTAAEIADPGTLAYGASKAAFARASRGMATELGAANVRVNNIAPGVTKTSMFDQMAPDARDKLINSAALKRAANPQDIANVALFLASDLSSFVTGQTLRVDGGMV